MQIYVHKNGEEWGPYTSAEVTEHLKKAVFSQEDFARTANMSEWIPLSNIVARFALEDRRDPPQTFEGEYSKEEIAVLKEIYTMAFFERRLIILFGVLLLIGFLCSIFATNEGNQTLTIIVAFGIIIPIFLYTAYCFLRFEAALYNWWIAIFLLIFGLIPGVLIIEMLVSYFAVKKRYKECGVERGFFGASARALQDLKSQIDSS
jgi:hypothetical protein